MMVATKDFQEENTKRELEVPFLKKYHEPGLRIMVIREMFNTYQKNNLSAGLKDIKGINQQIIYDHMLVGTNMS